MHWVVGLKASSLESGMTKPFLFFFFFPKRLLREKREISFHGRIRALIAKLFLSLQNDPIFNVLTDMYRREADDYHHRYRYLLFFIFFFFLILGLLSCPMHQLSVIIFSDTGGMNLNLQRHWRVQLLVFCIWENHFKFPWIRDQIVATM